jgi:phosphohistidine phosphatase SixA
VASALKAFDAESILCVGHAPNLDLVIAYLTGSEAPVTSMKKAGVASLEAYRMGRGTARLVGFYPPAVLRRLAEDPAV